jgi:hypothetical protein
MPYNQPKTESPAAVSSTPLVGREWKVVINGTKTLNARRYGATYTGTIDASGPDQTIYDVLRALAEYLETQNAEMEQPDSFQATLFPPNEQGQARRENQ